MEYLIPAGIGVSYVVFWFAMTEPVKGVGKKIGTNLRNKLGKRRTDRAGPKSQSAD